MYLFVSVDNTLKPNAEKQLDNMSSNMHSLALSKGGDPNQRTQNLITKTEASNLTQKQEEQTQIQNNNQISPATQCSVMHSSCITKVSVQPGQSCEDSVVKSENIPDESKQTKQVSISSQVPPNKKGDKKGDKERHSKKKGYDPDVFFKVNGKLYQKLGKIGSGGSSEVHKVISTDCTIYALKKIKLKGRDYPTALGFCQEIEYLNRLKGKSNIIQLIDYEVCFLFLVKIYCTSLFIFILNVKEHPPYVKYLLN
jgi:Protein kinase domain